MMQNQIVTTIVTLGTLVMPVIVGIIVTFVTQWLKKIQAVQLSDNRVVIIRVIANVLAFAGVLFGRYFNGSLADPSFINDTVNTLMQTFVAYIVAHTAYHAYVATPVTATNAAKVLPEAVGTTNSTNL